MGHRGLSGQQLYAPSARYNSRRPSLLDRRTTSARHRRIMDWVPAHFPKDAFALARFDGTALYEHLDPRRGEHPDWGTYILITGETKSVIFCWQMRCIVSRISYRRFTSGPVASMLYL